jgi:thiol-disulfide isomerase/thioredoxin
MNIVEQELVDIGLPWMWSKLLIYFFVPLISFFLAFYFIRKTSLSKRWKLVLLSLLTIIPLALYFALHPIYIGDISDNSTEIKTSYVFQNNKTLTIFVLKGCPHCKNTIPYVEKLHARNNQIPIRYVIIGKMDTKFPGFTNDIPNFCEKVYEPNALAAAEVTLGNYPCFILSSNGLAEKRWFNDDFGMRTMDIIESYFN